MRNQVQQEAHSYRISELLEIACQSHVGSYSEIEPRAIKISDCIKLFADKTKRR